MKRNLSIVFICALLGLLSFVSLAKNQQNPSPGTSKNTVSKEDLNKLQKKSDKLFDQAILGKVKVHVIQEDGSERTYRIPDLPHDEEDYLSFYEVGGRVDLDNDGITELIINGPYGGIYLDVRNGKVYELASGDGTACELDYAVYKGITYICHRDTTHMGREIFDMNAFDGSGKVVNSTRLSAEYWDKEYLDYDATCHFGEKEISVSEFLKLRKEIFGY